MNLTRRFAALYLVSCFLFPFFCSNAQSGTWIWMNGSNAPNSAGNYGTQGVASVNNNPPAEYQSAQWTDKQGNFWKYGGSDGTIQTYSDLWKYDPLANMWTWVSGPSVPNSLAVFGIMGVPSTSNTPGERRWGSATWTDSTGDLWLFGGYGTDSVGSNGNMSDLWRYHIASNEWTWMGGRTLANQQGAYGSLHQFSAGSIPPSRYEANTAWIDGNNSLWRFGGYCGACGGLGNGSYNDVWKYNIPTNQWAWMAGSQQVDAAYNYGTLNVESATNSPPPRNSYTHWVDGNYLYVTGGTNWESYFEYSDVWRFNTNTNYWTWVGGDSGNVAAGQYTQYCSSASGDRPRGRVEQRSAQVNGCSPVFFMWGGKINSSTSQPALNDLWLFDQHTGKWRWLSGSDTLLLDGNYGTIGVASPSNMPPGADGVCFWADNSGNLWLWGGFSFTLTGGYYSLGTVNAMWKYIPDRACIPADTGSGGLSFQVSPPGLCPGDTALITFTGGSSINISPNNSVTWLDSLHAKLAPDSTTVYTISGYSNCGGNVVQLDTLPVIGGTLSIQPDKTLMCPGDTARICAPTGFASYHWNNGDTTACINAHSAGNYYLTVSESGNCSVASNHVSISVYTSPPVTVSVNGDTLRGYGATGYQWLLNGVAITGAVSSVYIARTQGIYTLQVTDTNGCKITSNPLKITALQDVEADYSISVFPNPTNGTWQLTVAEELLGTMAEVFDATGRLVFKSEIRNVKSEIGFSAARGVYELRITRQDYSMVRKLVKM